MISINDMRQTLDVKVESRSNLMHNTLPPLGCINQTSFPLDFLRWSSLTTSRIGCATILLLNFRFRFCKASCLVTSGLKFFVESCSQFLVTCHFVYSNNPSLWSFSNWTRTKRHSNAVIKVANVFWRDGK